MPQGEKKDDVFEEFKVGRKDNPQVHQNWNDIMSYKSNWSHQTWKNKLSTFTYLVT